MGFRWSWRNFRRKRRDYVSRSLPETTEILELMVHMNCPGCERTIRKVLSDVTGVDSVDVDMKQQKVTVIGRFDPNKVLRKIRRTGKKAELWSQAVRRYNIRPSGSQLVTLGRRNSSDNYDSVGKVGENQVLSVFSDENPNNCSIM